MSSDDYLLHSAIECERLERQAALEHLEGHLRHFPPLSGRKVLDAGCGSGAIARMIAAAYSDCSVVGVDLNPAYIGFARRLVEAAALGNLSFEVGDLTSLPFADASFDVVWSRFVLNFLPRPETAIAEFRRVLRPGGSLIVSLHNLATLTIYPDEGDLSQRLTRTLTAILDVNIAPKSAAMLTAAGFQDVSVAIELDAIYSALGAVAPANRRNLAEFLEAIEGRMAEILGGDDKAQELIAETLAYWDRSDAYKYSPLWTIRGITAGGG